MHYEIRKHISLIPSSNSIPFSAWNVTAGTGNTRQCWRLILLVKFIPALLTIQLAFTTVSAQSFDKVIPMGEWLEPVFITYTGEPITLHFRTGYETAVTFPEPIALFIVDSRLVSAQYKGTLTCCDVEINGKEIRFSPLKRMNITAVSVRGKDSGTIYKLLVSSSPVGRRQPVEVLE